MSKALDSGKALLDAVLAKLPESLRADAQKAFTAPEAADALTLLGDSTLARSDYSKAMDDIKAKEEAITADYEKLTDWFTTNKATLDKVTPLEAEIARLKGEKPKEPEKVVALTQEDLQKAFDVRDQGYAAVLALSTTLATKHLRDFNEILDMTDLVTYATGKRIGLKEAYEQKFAEQIATKAKAAEDTRIQKLVDDKLTEERKKFTEQPFPLRNQQPSVLDILDTKDKKPSDHTVDTAVAEYERLTAARG